MLAEDQVIFIMVATLLDTNLPKSAMTKSKSGHHKNRKSTIKEFSEIVVKMKKR